MRLNAEQTSYQFQKTTFMNNKIRKAVSMKIPYVLVIGDREMKSDKLMVRVREQKDLRKIDKAEFITNTKELITDKSLELQLDLFNKSTDLNQCFYI